MAAIDIRTDAILPQLACGRELRVLGDLAKMNANSDYQPGEDLGAIVATKTHWLLRHGNWRARGRDEQLRPATCDLQYQEQTPSGEASEVQALALVRSGIPNALADSFGPECSSSRIAVTEADGWLTVNVSLTGACIRQQVNTLLSAWHNNRQIGTDGSICRLGLGGKSTGDYDVVVRDLTRAFFDDGRSGHNVLDEVVRTRVRDELLSISGPPLPDESYSFFECGNTEKYTGSPEDIAAEQGSQPLHEDVWDDLWPGIKWFLRRLIIVLAAAAGAAALASALATLSIPAAVAVLTAAGLGSFILTFGRIPETENHILMIESSRFLKNRILIEYYDAHGMATDAAEFRKHQDALRSWLLNKLHDVAETDFEEYNARPYQRYSLMALLNLHDFSEDAPLQTASQIILDRQFAKYVVGSSENRRFAPFRRQMHRLAEVFDNPGGKGVVDLTDSDFPAAMALAYIGETTHLPNSLAHRGAAQELAAIVMTDYRPPEMLIDLAMQSPGGLSGAGSDDIWQHRVRHASNEIYVRGRHFSIDAGGAQASWVNQLEILGVNSGIALDPNDRGAAFPTTLLLAASGQSPAGESGKRRDQLWQQIRIQGPKEDYSHEGASFHSYDRNLCVWKGFACGEDMRIPADLFGLAVTGPTRNGSTWRFIDTGACTNCFGAHRVFIALFTDFVVPTIDGDGTAHIGRGFFEAIDAEDAANDFTAFQSNVLSRNVSLGTVRGEYTTARGERVYFDATEQKGIGSVNGTAQPDLDDWPTGIDGNIIVRRDRGHVDVINRRMGRRLVLDFYSPISPTRQELVCTPAPCSP